MIVTIAISAALLVMQVSDINAPQTPTDPDQAGVIYWQGGTMVYAHNYLAGGLLYDMRTGDTITVMMDDGSEQEYILLRKTVAAPENWIRSIIAYSSPKSITFVTCWPEFPAPYQGNLLAQFVPIEPADPRTTRTEKP